MSLNIKKIKFIIINIINNYFILLKPLYVLTLFLFYNDTNTRVNLLKLIMFGSINISNWIGVIFILYNYFNSYKVTRINEIKKQIDINDANFFSYNISIMLLYMLYYLQPYNAILHIANLHNNIFMYIIELIEYIFLPYYIHLLYINNTKNITISSIARKYSLILVLLHGLISVILYLICGIYPYYKIFGYYLLSHLFYIFWIFMLFMLDQFNYK